MLDLCLLLGAALATLAVSIRRGDMERSAGATVLVAIAAGTSLVMVLANALAWALATLLPAHASRALCVILLAATIARIGDAVARREAALRRLLDAGGPLVTANAMVLAATVLADGTPPGNLLAAVGRAAAVSLGFSAMLLGLAALVDRLEESPMPKMLRRTPAAMLGAAIIGLAFAGLLRARP